MTTSPQIVDSSDSEGEETVKVIEMMKENTLEAAAELSDIIGKPPSRPPPTPKRNEENVN